MIPKKFNSTFMASQPKKSCSTNLIQRILIFYHLRSRIAIKKPYLTARNRLARKVWANEHALLPKFFWQNVLFSDKITLELHPNKLVLLRCLPNTGMEKEKVIGNPKILRKKSYAWGFYCPQWSEMSPKSLWNDKFDQIFADFARKSIAGKVFGRRNAAR